MHFQNKAKIMCKYAKGRLQQMKCVDKEQFKIKWLQTFYNVKWTFTENQIPRQNENFSLLSVQFCRYSMKP